MRKEEERKNLLHQLVDCLHRDSEVQHNLPEAGRVYSELIGPEVERRGGKYEGLKIAPHKDGTGVRFTVLISTAWSRQKGVDCYGVVFDAVNDDMGVGGIKTGNINVIGGNKNPRSIFEKIGLANQASEIVGDPVGNLEKSANLPEGSLNLKFNTDGVKIKLNR